MDVEEKAQMELDLNSTGQPLQGLSGIVTVKPATVSGNNPEAEVGVIAEQQWRGIQERGATGMSVSRIARELDLDRKTVPAIHATSARLARQLHRAQDSLTLKRLYTASVLGHRPFNHVGTASAGRKDRRAPQDSRP